MTRLEAAKLLDEEICQERPMKYYCTDMCKHGIEYCPISMAIDALQEEAKRRGETE